MDLLPLKLVYLGVNLFRHRLRQSRAARASCSLLWRSRVHIPRCHWQQSPGSKGLVLRTCSCPHLGIAPRAMTCVQPECPSKETHRLWLVGVVFVQCFRVLLLMGEVCCLASIGVDVHCGPLGAPACGPAPWSSSPCGTWTRLPRCVVLFQCRSNRGNIHPVSSSTVRRMPVHECGITVT